jgi:hypothetical protein
MADAMRGNIAADAGMVGIYRAALGSPSGCTARWASPRRSDIWP